MRKHLEEFKIQVLEDLDPLSETSLLQIKGGMSCTCDTGSELTIVPCTCHGGSKFTINPCTCNAASTLTCNYGTPCISKTISPNPPEKYSIIRFE